MSRSGASITRQTDGMNRPSSTTHSKPRRKVMQELLVDFITSLDGYGAAEGWPGWWGLEGPEYLA